MKIKMDIKSIAKKSRCLHKIGIYYRNVYRYFFPVIGHNNNFKISGVLFRVKKNIIGNNNTVMVGKQSIVRESFIRIYGNINKILIQNNCKIGKGSSFWIDGDDNTIIFRNNSTFTQFVHLCAQEKNTKIDIGEDCMFSNNIIVRTSDSHPCYYIDTNIRINPAKSVIIGSHVWIAPKATIMKGVTIGNGSIIGCQSVVTKDIPDNVLAVGSPAIVVKKNIMWTREHLF